MAASIFAPIAPHFTDALPVSINRNKGQDIVSLIAQQTPPINPFELIKFLKDPDIPGKYKSLAFINCGMGEGAAGAPTAESFVEFVPRFHLGSPITVGRLDIHLQSISGNDRGDESGCYPIKATIENVVRIEKMYFTLTAELREWLVTSGREKTLHAILAW